MSLILDINDHSCENSDLVGLGPHFGDKPQNLEWGCEVGAALDLTNCIWHICAMCHYPDPVQVQEGAA